MVFSPVLGFLKNKKDLISKEILASLHKFDFNKKYRKSKKKRLSYFYLEISKVFVRAGNLFSV
jgi:hypothetical protein